MAQANVYTSVSSQAWYTDRARISTGNTAVTFQVNMLYATPDTGNVYSNAASVPANWQSDVWVGVGNQLTVTGTNYTVEEIGTGTSGSRAVRQA